MMVIMLGYIQQLINRIFEVVKISNVQVFLEGVLDFERYYFIMGYYDICVLDVLNWWDDQLGVNDDVFGVVGKLFQK